jgi:hypothetical protein
MIILVCRGYVTNRGNLARGQEDGSIEFGTFYVTSGSSEMGGVDCSNEERVTLLVLIIKPDNVTYGEFFDWEFGVSEHLGRMTEKGGGVKIVFDLGVLWCILYA